MTTIHDLVLVHIESKPAFYARLEEIVPDVKPGWWQVKLLVLTVPMQIFTWILDESQINGASFTMGGTPIQMEKVVSPHIQESSAVPQVEPGGIESRNEEGKAKKVKVISLLDRKKKK